MHNRSASLIASLLLVWSAGACSSGGSTVTSDSQVASVPSFECIQALNATALSDGSTVGRARQNLGDLIVAPSSSDDEVEYYKALLGSMEGVADSDPIPDSFDDVACDLT